MAVCRVNFGADEIGSKIFGTDEVDRAVAFSSGGTSRSDQVGGEQASANQSKLSRITTPALEIATRAPGAPLARMPSIMTTS
jgi:hypothetical protein